MRFVSPIILIVVALGCGKGHQPVEIPSFDESAFAALYADILIVKSQTGRVERQEARIGALLRQRQLSVATYDSILAYYQRNPDQWLILLDQVDSLVTVRTEEKSGAALP